MHSPGRIARAAIFVFLAMTVVPSVAEPLPPDCRATTVARMYSQITHNIFVETSVMPDMGHPLYIEEPAASAATPNPLVRCVGCIRLAAGERVLVCKTVGRKLISDLRHLNPSMIAADLEARPSRGL